MKKWYGLALVFIAVGILTFLVGYFLGGMELSSSIYLTLGIVGVSAVYAVVSLSNVKKVPSNSNEDKKS